MRVRVFAAKARRKFKASPPHFPHGFTTPLPILLQTTFDVERPCTWSLVGLLAHAIAHSAHLILPFDTHIYYADIFMYLGLFKEDFFSLLTSWGGTWHGSFGPVRACPFGYKCLFFFLIFYIFFVKVLV